MQVKDIMTKNPITIKKDLTIKEATSIMRINNIDGLPVVDEDLLLGMITKEDIYQAFEKDTDTLRPVEDIMRKEIVSIKEEKKTEEILSMEIERMPVVDDDGKVLGILTPTDLLKAYHNNNKYITKELKTIFTAIHNGIMLVDNKGQIKNINKSGLYLIKSNRKDVIGKKINNFKFKDIIEKVLNNGKKSLGNTYKINGFNLVINVTPFKRKGKLQGVIVELNDITRLQDTLDRLNDEKNLTHVLRTILDNAYDGIVVIDNERKITMINNSYAKFLNVDKDEVIGKDITNVIENTRLHIVLETGESEIGEVQKVGSHNIVVMRIPIREGNKVVGVVGKMMFRDVQEVKSLAKKISSIEKELQYYKDELKKVRQAKYSFDNIPTKSFKMKNIKNLALKASKSNSTILITGESGTGKELFAHSIHNASPRHMKPFIKMNCAAIPSELLESELFGYEEGAFTGSRKGGKIGKFQLADGGTIFLDEIGDMPINMQAKILRVLQEREVEPIGAEKPIRIDVRVIAATNRDLEKLIDDGKFRKDLYYRLNVIKLNIPSLRERREDLEELTKVLFNKHRDDVGKYIPGIAKEVIEIFKSYNWPGNVRELENVIERAINLVDSGDMVRPIYLPQYIIGENTQKSDNSFSLKNAVEEAEKKTILDCLRYTDNNRAKASKIMGISRSTLYEKMDKYGLK